MNEPHYTRSQLAALVTVRILVGWHLLYEGVLKVWSPGAGGLQLLDHDSLALRAISRFDLDSGWVLAINVINTWGLVLAGIGLVLGLFGHGAALGATALMLGYGMAHAPLAWPEVQVLANPSLIETGVLVLLCASPTSHLWGADRLRLHLGRRPVAPLTSAAMR